MGLIIKGPLVTYGQGPNNTPRGFNTLETILGNIKESSKRGISHLISTWQPNQSIEAEILQKLTFVNANSITLAPPSEDPDHRLKHHYAIRKALDKLNTPYVIKVRTDMLMPEPFWDWVQANLDDRLIVSELFTPFYVGDFIYASSRTTMLRFLDGFLAYGNNVLHPSITTDIGFRFFESIKRIRISQWKILYNYALIREPTTLLWQRFVIEHIEVLPQSIFREILWRGRQIDSFINISAFKFDTLPNYPSADINFLLDEHIRYFRKQDDWRRFLVIFIRLLYKSLSRILRLPLKIMRLAEKFIKKTISIREHQ